MSSARGDNKSGSSNEYERKRLENIERIKRRISELNIPELAKDVEQQGRPRKTLKKKHSPSHATSKPDLQPSKPNLRPRPQRNNPQHEEDEHDDLMLEGNFLTDSVEDMQNNDTTNGSTKRAGRGITKMDEIFSRTPEMPKIKVQVNINGQPEGKTARQLSSAIGCHVRKKISIAHKDWRLIDIEKKLEVWTELKQYFDVDDAAMDWFLRSAHMKWKQFKTELKEDHFNPDVDPEKIPESPDERINNDDWKSIYKYWLTSEFESRSGIAKKNRKHRQLHHTTGSVSFLSSAHDLAVELGRPPRRDEIFVKTHMRKNGDPSPSAADTIAQIKDILEVYPEIKDRSIQEGDAFAIICGEKEPKGYVRCLGLGPTPQDIGTAGLKCYKPTRLQKEIFARNKAENEKAALQQRILELEAEIEQRAQQDRASVEPASFHGSSTHQRQFFSTRNVDNDPNDKDYASGDEYEYLEVAKAATPKTDTHSSPHDALIGKDVILYAWLRSNVPVAKGTIVSTKPDTIVGGEPIGRQYCEVIVTYVLKRDECLPRPYGNLKTMADSKMRRLAWPYKKLKVTNKETTGSVSRKG